MAKRTTTTKAKTKTTKSKTASAKSVNAKTTKKASKPEAVATKTKKPAISVLNLKNIYAASIVIYIAIAGAAYALMTTASYQLSVGYWAKDELASSTQTVFAPATQGVYDIQIRFVVMAVALLSAVIPALYLTRLKKYHEQSIKNKVLPTRWLDMAVVAAIMLETVALVSGVLDVGTLKLIGGLMVVTCILGWMAEKRTAEAGKPATAKYYLSMVTGILPWIVIAIYAVSTVVYGEIRSPWFVYALYAVMLIAAGLIGTNQLKGLKAEGPQKNYEVVERNYAVLGLLARTAFSVVLIVGLMSK